MAWDFNLLSLDGYSPETGWVRIDTSKLASVHISSFEKRRSVQRKASKSKKAKKILAKYSKRERNRAKKHQLEIARAIQSVAGVVGIEELSKRGMYARSRAWNRRISRSDWRGIARILTGRMGEAKVKELDPLRLIVVLLQVWVGKQRPEWSRYLRVFGVRAQNRQTAQRRHQPLRAHAVRVHREMGGRKEAR